MIDEIGVGQQKCIVDMDQCEHTGNERDDVEYGDAQEYLDGFDFFAADLLFFVVAHRGFRASLLCCRNEFRSGTRINPTIKMVENHKK